MVFIQSRTTAEVDFKLNNLSVHITESGVLIYSGLKDEDFCRYLPGKRYVDDNQFPEDFDLKRYELIGKLLAKY